MTLKTIIISILSLITCTWLAGAVIFVSWLRADNHLPEDAVDAVIVLTGDAHRIEKGFTLLRAKKADNLLISGVYKGTSLEDMVENTNLSTADQQAILRHCCIVMDYKAESTTQNAANSAAWIKDRGWRSIILVTSDYHMPRAAWLFNKALLDGKGQSVEIHHASVISKTPWRSFSYWRHVIDEYHKLIITATYRALSPPPVTGLTKAL